MSEKKSMQPTTGARSSRIGRFLLPMLLPALAACGSQGSGAGVAASTQHCGGEVLTPTLHTRLSRYSAGIPSDDVYVLQLCHPDRGCMAVASYENGLPPIPQLTERKLRFEVPMTQSLRVFDDEVWVDGREIPLEIEALPVRTDEQHRAVLRRLGIDPLRNFSHACLPDVAPRPYLAQRRREG